MGRKVTFRWNSIGIDNLVMGKQQVNILNNAAFLHGYTGPVHQMLCGGKYFRKANRTVGVLDSPEDVDAEGVTQ